MKSDILNKVDELISEIEKSDDYQKYLLLKEEMNKDKELNLLIREIKVLQKDVVHKMDKKELLNKKMDELNDYPLYREYQNTLSEINNTFAIIENSLNNYFNDKFN